MLHHATRRAAKRTCNALLTAIALAGCGSSNLIGPENQLEVTNAADNFEFQVSNMDNVSQSLSYLWENTGNQATIDISQAMTAGSAVLTIRDDAGTIVHQEDLRNDNDTDTAVGVAGNWSIDLQLNGASGTLNFRVQRRT